MSARPKKAASKKAASKATSKAGTPPAETPETEPSPEVSVVDGVQLARMRRLARAGFEGADRCAMLGLVLDTGPRVNRWQNPRMLGGVVVSELAAAIVESRVSPEVLDLAAARLRGES